MALSNEVGKIKTDLRDILTVSDLNVGNLRNISLTFEGIPTKGAYIAFLVKFFFHRILLILYIWTCFDMMNVVLRSCPLFLLHF